MVASFESGVTVPMSGAAYAAARNRSSQPGGAKVSLFSSTASRGAQARSPAFAAAGKPRFSGSRIRRMRFRRASASSAATKSGSGEASSITQTRVPRGTVPSTESRQVKVCARPR